MEEKLWELEEKTNEGGHGGPIVSGLVRHLTVAPRKDKDNKS